MESATHTMKIIVVGNSGVGKTSLIKRYIEGDIPRAHIATLGMELESKTMKFPKGNIKLHIWDTAGQEQYQSLTKSYFAGSSLAIIVFDVTDPTSYREIFKWLEIIQNNTIHEIQIFLAGNKADLDSGRCVSEAQGREVVERGLVAKYFDVSAKTGSGIEEMFKAAGETLLEKAIAGNEGRESLVLFSEAKKVERAR